jgi:hypothetical protein
MRTQDAIAEGVLSTKPGMARYLVAFDDTSHTRQAPNLPNHVAWCLGHLALTMHRVCEKIRPGHALPASDFIEGGTKAGGGDTRRFATESVSFGSQPVADAKQYPGLARSMEIYDAAVEAVADAIRATPDADLGTLVDWGAGMQLPKYLIALRMIGHNGMHIGQIADLRRALGFKSIFS